MSYESRLLVVEIAKEGTELARGWNAGFGPDDARYGFLHFMFNLGKLDYNLPFYKYIQNQRKTQDEKFYYISPDIGNDGEEIIIETDAYGDDLVRLDIQTTRDSLKDEAEEYKKRKCHHSRSACANALEHIPQGSGGLITGSDHDVAEMAVLHYGY